MEFYDDRTKFDDIQSELEKLDKHALEVGFFGGTEDNNFYAMIAYVHEFGMTIKAKKSYLTIPTKEAGMRKASEIEGLFRPKGTDILAVSDGSGGLTVMFYLKKQVKIPERSFMRTTFDTKINSWLEFFEDQIELVVTGELKAKQCFERLGQRMVSDIQQKMTDVRTPPLSPATVQRKGSTNPLLDTGELRRRVTYKVVTDYGE